MAAEIVNLNKVRKAIRKSERKNQADENSVKFGRTKAEKKSNTFQGVKIARHLDAHKLEQ